ncbi:hypothetical protein K435DRAFT_905708 [Dendrothele bispora CBS 962.96]|uniref:Uncharacterized protein n=1 Tax=Dendrothele bispora (strain CBS 962.96) TaxID=1314807 RepID=A0A4S8KK54_DENBC|nr:hypothetical protein K435DRAFT_905708 [Dendrothele bispora CBS 962.96]
MSKTKVKIRNIAPERSRKPVKMCSLYSERKNTPVTSPRSRKSSQEGRSYNDLLGEDGGRVSSWQGILNHNGQVVMILTDQRFQSYRAAEVDKIWEICPETSGNDPGSKYPYNESKMDRINAERRSSRSDYESKENEGEMKEKCNKEVSKTKSTYTKNAAVWDNSPQ